MKWKKAVLLLAGLLILPQITRASGVTDDVYFYCNTGGEKKIALTFDDGPHPVYTREILEILDSYGIPATFFIIGVNAEQYPELVQAELAAGHEIGNHTYRHLNLQREAYETVRGEILETENLLGEMTEQRLHLFRPPGGLYCDAVCRAAAELEYTVILWSVDTRDWAHPSVEDIVENVMTNADSGDIILFHDYVSGHSPTPEALRRILPELIARGYQFVTVSELLGENS
ncbi:MAG: polysaccharide deacetylase family protein [Ruminococcaceae bacterium]|nr:polysaccharide deacetylase family protein [Oscillospiraceae bacterium]